MFGLFKRGGATPMPNEPIELEVAIEIERSADAVYTLLDWADERNQMRARGNTVRRETDQPEVYRLWYDRAPELNFLFTVTEAIPGRSYGYRADILPLVGRRIGSHEHYTLEPFGPERCKVTFTNAILHQPGLTRDQLAEEIGMSSTAAANSLTKLKLQAEQGAAAVDALERELGQR